MILIGTIGTTRVRARTCKRKDASAAPFRPKLLAIFQVSRMDRMVLSGMIASAAKLFSRRSEGTTEHNRGGMFVFQFS